VDFSVAYPAGRLVDAPLPTWTHRELLLCSEFREPAHAAVRAVHPLLGAHVRLREEPERHFWQGDVGTTAHPWLDDNQVHGAATLPGAAYCEMALAAARAIVGEASEVCDLRFEHALLLDSDTQILCAATGSGFGVFDFSVDTDEAGAPVRLAGAALRSLEESWEPPVYDIGELIAAHPRRVDVADVGVHCGVDDVHQPIGQPQGVTLRQALP